MATTYAGYIVVYDDEQGVTMPMGADPECDGALEGVSAAAVTMFETAAQAKLAIRISERWAALQQAQGRPVNEDFTTGRRHLKIRPLKAWTR